jgi:hypothetical protein
MALKFEDVAKPETLIVSAGLALLWRYVFPLAGAMIGPVVRPVAKAAIKGGMVAANWASETAGNVREAVGDIGAEALQETHQRHAESHGEAKPGDDGEHRRPSKADTPPAPAAP